MPHHLPVASSPSPSPGGKQRYGINNLVSRLINVHYFYVIIFEIYGVCIWGISLFRQSQQNHGSAMNIVIIGICLFTMAILLRVCRSPAKGSRVWSRRCQDQPVRLVGQAAWRGLRAHLGQQPYGEPDGTHALGLLTGFSRWKTGDNISGTWLRVYHEEHDKEQPPQSTHAGWLDRRPQLRTWQGKARQSLDEENWI
jgi:hypothetical protein